MISVVLDSSVIVKWFLSGEPEGERALAIRERVVRGSIDALAPTHGRLEVCDALRKAARQGRFRIDDLAAAARAVVAFDIWVDDGPLLERGAELATELEVSVYDAVFLALAEQRGAPLLTADAQLHGRAGAAGHHVLPLADVPLG